MLFHIRSLIKRHSLVLYLFNFIITVPNLINRDNFVGFSVMFGFRELILRFV